MLRCRWHAHESSLERTHCRTTLFETAREMLGDQGVVELIGGVGFYAMLAYMHNALDVRVPQA